MAFRHKLGAEHWVQLGHCRAGDLNSVLIVPHTMSAWGIAPVLKQCYCCCCWFVFVISLLMVFYQILFYFLDNLFFFTPTHTNCVFFTPTHDLCAMRTCELFPHTHTSAWHKGQLFLYFLSVLTSKLFICIFEDSKIFMYYDLIKEVY